MTRYTELKAALEKRAALIIIVDRKGSAPNGPGAKMLVFEDGSMRGTVGGGVSEIQLVKRAHKLLHEPNPRPEIIHLRHDGKGGPEGSGMICSGEQTFLLLVPGTEEIQTLNRTAELEQSNREVTVEFTSAGIHLEEAKTDSSSLGWTWDHTENWSYRERAGHYDRAILIGGGHVSRALSEVLSRLDYHITVLDNRPDLPTMADNSFADEIRVVNFGDIARDVPEGDRTYVCIITFGYRFDEDVLRQLAGRNYRYLGMMGSRTKVDIVLANLRENSISDEALKSVHAPIGVPISSQTPEEIAISIAAEMIRVRRA